MPTLLTAGRPWRVILAFSIPLFLGNIVQQLYQFTDAIVVGRQLGVSSLASVGATSSLIFMLMGFAWGAASGFAIPTAQAFGARDHEAVRRSVATGTLLAAAGSLILTVAAPLLAGPALRLLRTPESLLAEATTYAQVTFLGTAALLFFNYLAALIRAIGDSRTPLIFLAITAVLNIGLVLLLVGPLALGVGGAALATVIAQAISVLLCLALIRRRIRVLIPHRTDWRPRGDLVRRHLRLGLPMGFQASIIAIGSLAVQIRLNTLGPDAVAAFTSASRIDMLAYVLLQSLGLAASVYVAQNLGAGHIDRIRQGVRHTVWMVVIAAAVIGAGVLLLGPHAIRLFIGDQSPQVLSLATLSLTVNGSLYIIVGVLFVVRGSLQGLGLPLAPTVSGAIELAMRVVTAVVLGAAFGYAGVVWGTPLAWVGSVALLIPAYLRASRRLTTHALQAPTPETESPTETPAPVGAGGAELDVATRQP